MSFHFDTLITYSLTKDSRQIRPDTELNGTAMHGSEKTGQLDNSTCDRVVSPSASQSEN